LFKELIVKKALFVLMGGLIGCQALANTSSDKCHFDHQLVTLSHDTYVSVQSFFSQPQNSQKIDVTWNDDSSDPLVTKGFLRFSDGTYMEIWDAGNMLEPGLLPDEVGFQDGCRVKNFDTILQFSTQYKVGLVDTRPFMQFATVGRNGQVGDPDGGMFFIWYTFLPELDESKFGIHQILKNVRPDDQGKPNARLISDYSAGGLSVSVKDHVLRAVDYMGRSRIVTADPAYPVGLIAVRFSRSGTDSSDIEIPKSSGNSEQVSLQQRPGYGTLVFQPNAFKANAGLLDAPAASK
jgi:hypothetical protein